ncbi:MAG: hypothetical protein G01um101429_614 [Parcubacteria group bacterium Gr01-1014_29]|nr:MAG: hypothetical protein G01um101429_614 [Parcubacteria group bacterium Gr01-1014_29]
MRIYVIAIIGFIGAALVFLIMFVGSSDVSPPPALTVPQPHAYDNPVELTADIQVTAVYFVPQGATPVPTEVWHTLLERELARLQKFHDVQFRGSSRVTYTIHPQAVVGRETHAAYDINLLQHNDPQVLRPVAEEILDGLKISLDTASPYKILLVLYEGVGAGGSKHVALLSRIFFERSDTRDVASTFFAHEFYHALGVPDGYRTAKKVFPDGLEVDVELIQSRDIMGRVRVPLEEAYLSPETLTALGI